MRKGEVRFVTAVARSMDLPPCRRPEVIFAGRSNVGKSSLINAVVKRHRLARVSRTPGRTRELHFYESEGYGTLVDFPGFGYAKVSKEVRAGWKTLVEGYFQSERSVALCLLLVDARHAPSDQDVLMCEWLRSANVPMQVILSKADGIPKSRVGKAVLAACERLQLDHKNAPIPVSTRSGRGIQDVRALLRQVLTP